MKRKIAQKHLSEVQLDALARAMAVSADPERIFLDPHISGCSSCKAEFEMLLGLYRSTARELETPHDLRVKTISHSALMPGFVELLPFQTKTEVLPEGEEMLLLAAQGPEARAGRYQHVGTFASEQAHTLVRIIRDAERKELHLHLLTPLQGDEAHQLIAVTIPGRDTYVLATDADGIAELPDPGDGEWRDVAVLVSPLIASFAGPFGTGQTAKPSSGGAFLDILSSPGDWQVAIHDAAGSKSGHLVAVGDDGSATVFEVQSSRVSLPPPVTGRLRELRLFH
jgi:hypothetical protein